MKVLKLTDSGLTINQIVDKVGQVEGTKFSLKFKRGRRWKLKSFRITHYWRGVCGDCGSYEQLEFQNSKGSISLCSHFGPSYLVPSMLSKIRS